MSQIDFLRTQEPQRPDGRHPDDFYATPRWAVVAILEALCLPESCMVLEPSCGDGAVLDVFAEVRPDIEAWGMELSVSRSGEARRRGHTVVTGDFIDDVWMEPGQWAPISSVFGNPPYSLAQEFVEHALGVVVDGTDVTFLLRLGFLASKRRAHLYAPGSGFRRLDVLPRRPSFTPDGKTDSSDYAWFTWRKGFEGPAIVNHL